MVIVRGTERFRDRVPGAPADADDKSSTFLGCWYATLLRWRPLVALFVNEATLLPLLVPAAPARALLSRLPAAVGDVLAAHHLPRELITSEVGEMADVRVARTANRSVVGMMNEFGYLAQVLRDDYADNLTGLSVRLAATPCGPLYRRQVSPDRELAALAARQRPR